MKYLNRKFQQGGQAPQQGGEQDVVQQIAQALQKGAKPEQILQALVKQGMPQDQATQMIQGILQQMKAKHEQGGKLNLLASLKKGGFLNKKKGEPMVKEETKPSEKPVDKKAAFMQMLADKKKGKVEKAYEGTAIKKVAPIKKGGGVNGEDNMDGSDARKVWMKGVGTAKVDDTVDEMGVPILDKSLKPKKLTKRVEKISTEEGLTGKDAIDINPKALKPVSKKQMGGYLLTPKKEPRKLISNKCGGKAKKAESGTTLPGFNIPKVDKDSGANTTKKKPTEEKVKKNAKGDKLDKKEAYSKNSIKGLEPKDVFKKGAKMKKCTNGCGCNKLPKLSMHKNGGRLQEICSCCGEVCN